MRVEIPSTRSQYSVKVVETIINLDADPNYAAKDARANIAEVNIMVNQLTSYLI